MKIVIDRYHTWRWLRMLPGTICLILAPMTIGIVLESEAMQWFGFVMAFLSLLALTIGNNSVDRRTVHSIAEARIVLDEMEQSDD